MTTQTSPAPAVSAVSDASKGADAPLRVAVVLGSNREGRFGPVIADWVLAHVRERSGFEVEFIDLAEDEPPSALSFSPSPEAADRLGRITPKLAAADAFVVLTPEYNHSFPAPLKTLIDWHRAEWEAKPVAFVSYGGISGGLRAVEQLRQVFAELHAVTVRDTVSFHNAGALFDDAGNHLDPAGPDAAAKTMLDQLTWWGIALREAKEVRPYGS
ncbi:FMN-dependent NADPH-azoreductase [Streptomyces sp. YIM 130001]|uniref:NADPH-dependent FMN reductase n=1 Tax=Streptomyces sp. YIM 130001 TaxID=2259644 RepID=UPI000E6482EE|nr:NAD(P)H-dependent oxidoreductase [Streptomyces sp. YIM 130001]RII17250.1 FMN-dependent NADPH-azoreductase [Streptomyces sp. YIM 130001]